MKSPANQLITAFLLLSAPAIISCNGNTITAKTEQKPKDTIAVQKLSDSVSASHEGMPMNPHAEDMMRIMEKMKSGMASAESTGNFDADFSKLMSIHHQGAIEMADLELRAGTNERLKEMTEETADLQKKEMAELMDIVKDIRLKMTSAKADTSSAAKRFIDSLYIYSKAMGDSMDAIEMTGDVDKDFAGMMIPHHKGAIVLSQIAAKNTKNPKLKKIAQGIISVQQDEVKDLQAWLSKDEKEKQKENEKLLKEKEKLQEKQKKKDERKEKKEKKKK